MKGQVSDNMQAFGRRHGWANRLLRVDLSAMRISVQETAPYVPQYLGARGLAARLCWDEIGAAVDPLHPANPLMIIPGALTGSRAPYSGRSIVCAFSPQAFPRPWFTRSSVGGYVGAQLKRAGYDGLIVTGCADSPVRIHIHDDQVSIYPADELWGLDAMDTLAALASAEGKGVRALVIGPAGERLSRIATIQTDSASACGQGGFGAVMGSKKLKAISVAGTGRVLLAAPDTVTALAKRLALMAAEDGQRGPFNFYGDIERYDRRLGAAGDGQATCRACAAGCITPCVAHLEEVPGVVYDRRWSGDWICAGRCFLGPEESMPPEKAVLFDWHLGRRAAFELNVLSNRYGLNQFDLLIGMVPWLIGCQKAGLIQEINGLPLQWRSPAFWAEFLRAIAYREGLGDVLADGGWQAANTLDMGVDLARQRYPGWGHTAHCDPFGWGTVFYPYWIVSALQWLSDTRDPFNSGHGYLWAASAAERAAGLESAVEREAALEQLRRVGARVYRSPDAVDPYSDYGGKAYAGHYQTVRAVIKDCVPLDVRFPLIYRRQAADGYWHLGNIEGVGEVEGPSVEYHLFKAGTGVPWSEEEFLQAAERVCTLERALQVRYFGRDRTVDETVLPYFERTELCQSPFRKQRYGLDRQLFEPVLDEFYALHGWAPESGRPTRACLSELGMGDLYEAMMGGASRASEGGGQRPPEPVAAEGSPFQRP
ncbi:MAG: aldehyde ferredoxin oxidoreductase N-terminal domain-containing protein [Anaerolineae bacterium]|jgi:aldehyde:ferredoxin oxidoreductase